MRLDLLDVLECPFCGGALQLERQGVLDLHDGEVRHGILTCNCCAYPVVAGVPYVRTGTTAEQAMALLGDGRAGDALSLLLGVPADDAARRDALLRDGDGPTFREALGL